MIERTRRWRQYCSDRCRMRARHQRQADHVRALEQKITELAALIRRH